MNPRAFNPWKPSPSMASQIDDSMFKGRLPQAGKAYVEACLSNGPSRAVQGRSGNNTFTYFSRKTQATLKLESRRGEQAMAIRLDHDPTVVAFFAQPPQVSLDVCREDGSLATIKPYTPDFLVVYQDRITVIETKDAEKLEERARKNPHQFYRDPAGVWHHRAAESHFAKLGIEFRLLSTRDHPAALVGNLRFLEDYFDGRRLPLTEEEINSVRLPVAERGFISIDDLLASGVPADHIYQAIAEQHVYFDLEGDSLTPVEGARIFKNRETREALRLVEAQAITPPPPIPGTLHLRSGGKLKIYEREYTVILEGERDVRLLDKHGGSEVVTLRQIQLMLERGEVSGDALRVQGDAHQLADFSGKEIEAAQKKLAAVEAGHSPDFSERSISRFRRGIAGVHDRIQQLILLIGRGRQKGNREPRISEVNRNLIEKVIEQNYNTSRQSTMLGAYSKYRGLCVGEDADGFATPEGPAREESGAAVRPVSYQTFCRYCRELLDVEKRRGRRAAYQKKAIVASLDNAFPAHGVRPHEVCEVDHTVANIALVSPTGMALGKPTLSIMVDSHTCQTRALVMSFEAPSARTVLRLVRDYVRRNNRLPRVLVVDNGKEFHSHELELFCRIYGIEIRYRSPGMPRGAATVERTFGAIETEVLSEMEGNTQIMKQDTRQVTKSVDPFRQAKWTLVGVYRAVEKCLFVTRHNRVHPALGLTPNEFERQSDLRTGQRDFRMYTLDENMMLMTCPHAKRPKRKVIDGRGVNVYGVYYRHRELDKLRPNTSVEVRVEPYNASVIYVNTGHRWVAATGNSSRWLGKRTHFEFEAAIREEQRVRQVNAKRDRLSMKSLRHKMVPLTPESFDPRIAEQQREMCHLDEQLGLTSALKEVPTALQALAEGDNAYAPETPPADEAIPFPAEKATPLVPLQSASLNNLSANEAEYSLANRFGLR